MSESSVRAKIKTTLSGVSGIGTVHDYERTSRSPATYLELMRPGGASGSLVNGWTIRRRSTASQRASTNILIRRTHRYEINGIYGPVDDDDATEKTFQALLESIWAAFKSDYTIGGTCENSGQIQIEDVDFLEFHETLYHVAALTIECIERATA